MTALRQVLNLLENTTQAMSLHQMAKTLQIDPPMLEEMLAFWVRKGKIREIHNPSACHTCGSSKGCPFILQMPRRYELVTNTMLSTESENPHCACGQCG